MLQAKRNVRFDGKVSFLLKPLNTNIEVFFLIQRLKRRHKLITGKYVTSKEIYALAIYEYLNDTL